MTTIPFDLPTIEEELQELALAGITVLVPASGASGESIVQPASDPADTDAAASWLLRRMAELDAEIQRTNAAAAREIELLMARVKRQTDPLVERRATLEALVLELARRADFGKKKSREVGSGTYGRRLVADKLEVQNEDRAIVWAWDNLRDAVRVGVKLPAAEAIARLDPATQTSWKLELVKKELASYVKSTGDIPDGCDLMPAHDEPFCKVTQGTETGEG